MPLRIKATPQGLETEKIVILKKGGGNCASRAKQGITPKIISVPTFAHYSTPPPSLLVLTTNPRYRMASQKVDTFKSFFKSLKIIQEVKISQFLHGPKNRHLTNSI